MSKAEEQKVYELSDVPLEKASNVENAVKLIDKSLLTSLFPSKTSYSRNELTLLARIAKDSGYVESVRASVPTKGEIDLVDLNEFPGQFREFMRDLSDGKAPQSLEDVREMLLNFEPNGQTQPISKRIRDYALSRGWTLRLAESWNGSELKDYLALSSKSPFPAFQIEQEILELLKFIRSAKPNNILEIGTARGGTLYLFTKVASDSATIMSVDLKIERKDLLSSFGRKQQTVSLLEADSRAKETIDRIQLHFPNGIDLLFIDGDHSFEGVETDFNNYSGLVNPGGMIVFHDIVPDNETRYGVITGGWAGGVPEFWSQVKNRFQHKEFVDDPDQDGLGIGVLITASPD